MPQFEIEVFVKLRVPDRVALTAYQALERMSYGDKLNGLRREDYYILSVDAKDEAAAMAVVKSVVEDTPIFANPNKHTVRIEVKQRPCSADKVFAALTYGSGGLQSERILNRVSNAGFDRIAAVGKGNIWYLEMAENADEEAAEDIIVTASRQHGLLINPHSEKYEII